MALLAISGFTSAASELLLIDSGATPEPPWTLDDQWSYGGVPQKLSMVKDDDGRWISKVEYFFDDSIPGSDKGEVKILRSIGFKEAAGAEFMLRASDSQTGLSVRIVDSSGQWLFSNIKMERAGQWFRVKLPFLRKSFNSHWAGIPTAANDGEIRFPVCHIVLVARKGAQPGPARGELLIKDFSLIADAPSPALGMGLKISAAAPDGIAFAGEKASFRVAASNRTDSIHEAFLRFHSVSDDGRSMDESLPLSFRKAGESGILEIPMDCSEPRFYAVKAWIEEGGRRIAGCESALSVVRRPVSYGKFDPDAFFGIVGGPGRGTEGCARIGSKNERVWTWLYGNSERPFKASALMRTDQALEEARAHFMNAVMTLNIKRTDMPVKAGWKEPADILASPEASSYWREVAGFIAERYRGKVAAIELVNEPDNEIWHGPNYSLDKAAAAYAALLKIGREAIKERAPEMIVSGLDVSGRDFNAPDSGPSDQIPGDFKFSKAVLAKAPGVLDCCGGHPYSHNRFLAPGRRVQLPEELNLRGLLAKLGDVLVANGCPRRIWSTEMGWAIVKRPEPLDETSRLFAAIAAQAMTLAKTAPGVEKAFWFISHWHSHVEPQYYDLFQCSYFLPRKVPFCVRCTETLYPTLAASSYSACASMLEKARFEKEIAGDGLVSAWRFQRTDAEGSVIAFWARRDGALTFEAEMPSEAEALNGVGRTVSKGRSVSIAFDRQPVYLRVSSKDGEAIDRAFLSAKVKATEPLIVKKAFLASPSELRILLEKPDNAPLEAQFEIMGMKTARTFADAGEQRIALPLPSPAASGAPLSLKTTAGSTAKSVDVASELLSAGHLAKPKIDGSLAAAAGLQPVRCDGKVFLFPPDATWNGTDDLSATAYFGWNEEGLYFAAKVRDDVHSAPSDGPKDFWKSDSVQIAIDPEGWSIQEYDGNVRELGLVLGNSGPKAFIWSKEGGAKEFKPSLAITRLDGLTKYEAFFKWDELGIPPPEAGKIMPLNFIVNENDGQGRSSWMGLTPGLGDSKAPVNYKSFIFER